MQKLNNILILSVTTYCTVVRTLLLLKSREQTVAAVPWLQRAAIHVNSHLPASSLPAVIIYHQGRWRRMGKKGRLAVSSRDSSGSFGPVPTSSQWLGRRSLCRPVAPPRAVLIYKLCQRLSLVNNPKYYT